MSLITRCPACGTLFKVVADQLKISEGWVRCGQCREVFDAQAYMSTPAPLQPKPDLPMGSGMAVVVPVELDMDTDSVPSAIQADAKAKAKAKATIIHQDFASSDWINSVNPPAPKEYVDSASSTPPSLLPSELSPEELELVGGLSMAMSGVSADSSQARLTGQALSDEVLDSAEGTPSFVRQAQRAQRWRSPWVRAMLLLVAAVLVAALGLQWVLQERDRIAAAEPRALPWLQQLCGLARCTVGPLRQIDAVVVDASSFNKQRSEGKFELYQLGLSLKNTGTVAVALPHIELSLNDAQDMPVLRRVLNPADLGASQQVLAPAAEFAGGTTVQIDSTQLAGARIAGYRVLAFYP
jgi:predicted Zn finger-like uncharacterized protein